MSARTSPSHREQIWNTGTNQEYRYKSGTQVQISNTVNKYGTQGTNQEHREQIWNTGTNQEHGYKSGTRGTNQEHKEQTRRVGENRQTNKK